MPHVLMHFISLLLLLRAIEEHNENEKEVTGDRELTEAIDDLTINSFCF